MRIEKCSSQEIFDSVPTSTVYGERFLHARNPVVFIAPHGVNDFHTAEIVRELAKSLDSGYIINTRFSRRQHHGVYSESVQDFNRPHFPSVDGDSLLEATEGYKHFLQDYHFLSHLLLVQYPNIRPAIFHIHGMKNMGDILVDIGIGLGELTSQNVKDYARSLSNSILSIDPKAGSHITAQIHRTQDLQSSLNKSMEKVAWVGVQTVSIGKYHSASEPNRLSQIGAHLWRHIDEIQIELAASLREESQREVCIGTLAQSIREVYLSSEQ